MILHSSVNVFSLCAWTISSTPIFRKDRPDFVFSDNFDSFNLFNASFTLCFFCNNEPAGIRNFLDNGRSVRLPCIISTNRHKRTPSLKSEAKFFTV